MNRRDAFLAWFAMVAGGAPLRVAAQDARKVHNIGILGFSGTGSGPTGPQPLDKSVSAFLGGMNALGYRYGEHFVAESRGPGGNPERLPALVAELVPQQPDVIIADGGVPALTLQQATSTIPTVMAASVDPVGKILQGAQAGDLAIELPSKFDLIVKLKAAKGLGLTIPQSLLCAPTR